MELRRIRYFVAIAEEENMHRAAEKLHIAQPAMTRQMNILEQEIGVKLFERLPRGLRLSSAGKAFLNDAQALLNMAKLARDRAYAVGTGRVGKLRIGFHEVVHRYAEFCNFLAEFSNRHPQIEFQLTAMSSKLQVEALSMGRLDCAFIYVWEKVPRSISTIALRGDEYGIVLPENHRLASRTSIDLREMSEERFIWIDRTQFSIQSHRLMSACDSAGFVPNIVYEGLSSEAAVRSLVSSGLGCALLPLSIGEQSARGVRVVPCEQPLLSVELHLAWLTESRSPLIEPTVEIAQRIASEGRASVAHQVVR